MHSPRFLFQLAGLLLLGQALLSSGTALAQQLPAPRDTSFTVHSALRYIEKTYPEARIARPAIPATIRTQTNVTYCTLGSRALQLDVFHPKAKTKKGYPAVLFIHGGGWRSGNRSQHVPMAQQLAARGYVTVTVEYRLSTEARYPAAVHDLKAAVRWLRANAQQYSIDTTKMAVWGFSAGGQLAALVGTTNGDKQLEGNAGTTGHSSSVQAIVDVDGVLAFIHPESREGDDSKSLSAGTLWFGASTAEKPELWQQASSLNHVTAHTPPILFINSSVDWMHAGREDLIKKLDTYHIYHEVHTLPNTPHTFPLFAPWFATTLDYTEAFLNKVFKR